MRKQRSWNLSSYSFASKETAEAKDELMNYMTPYATIVKNMRLQNYRAISSWCHTSENKTSLVLGDLSDITCIELVNQIVLFLVLRQNNLRQSLWTVANAYFVRAMDAAISA